MSCDLPRRSDLDGRGNLSEEALAEFTRFFLEACLDQVRFMEDHLVRFLVLLGGDVEIVVKARPKWRRQARVVVA
jgi:hypothetical protein